MSSTLKVRKAKIHKKINKLNMYKNQWNNKIPRHCCWIYFFDNNSHYRRIYCQANKVTYNDGGKEDNDDDDDNKTLHQHQCYCVHEWLTGTWYLTFESKHTTTRPVSCMKINVETKKKTRHYMTQWMDGSQEDEDEQV